jgi:hypothetical protein
MQLYLALPSTVLKINMVCNKLNFRVYKFYEIVMGQIKRSYKLTKVNTFLRFGEHF